MSAPTKRLMIALLAVSLAATATLASKLHAAAEDDQQVEDFLARLGLVDLQILHLEKVLAKTADAPQQLTVARRLADLYAARLMQTADDKARYDEILESIRGLVDKFPEANTAALQVMLLQADFARAETLFNRWNEDRGDTDALDGAKQILVVIAPQLHTHQEELSAEVDKLLLKMDKANPSDLPALEKELARLSAALNRATYFSGWSNYFCGVARRGAAEAAQDFANAKASFLRFLGMFPDDKYEELDVRELNLSPVLRSKALIGLGQAEIATGNIAQADILFKLLGDVSVPLGVRAEAPVAYMQGLLNVGENAPATEFASKQIDGYQGRASQANVLFCVTLIRIGFTSPQRELRGLGDLGVRGLAKLGEIGLAHQVLAKYDVKLDAADSFYLTWLDGHARFAEAEQTKSDDDYKAAAEELQRALAHADARKDPISAGRCRYTLGWCLYRRSLLEESAEQFQQAATSLKDAGGDSAVQSAWMAFVSLYTIALKERRFITSAIDVGEGIQRDFPGSEQAKNAEYRVTVLRQKAGTPEETIADLLKIGPGEPSYLAARFDLCRVYHEQWLAARGTAKAAEWVAKLESAAESFLFAARTDANVERKLKCVLWTVDVAVNGATFDAAAAAKAADLLSKAAPLVSALPASSSAVADYHYKLLQLAKKQGADERVREEADWLAKNAAGSVYEQSALVVLAGDIEQALKNASGDQRQALVQQAKAIYGRFAELVGQTPKVMADVKNARVVNSRLAQYDYELGNHREAADRAVRLLQAFPDDRIYLRLAGLSQYYAGQYETAIEHWRTLVQGLPKNTPAWYEAKYFQLASLVHFDKPNAVEAYKQFVLLYPKVESEPWLSDREGLRRLVAN